MAHRITTIKKRPISDASCMQNLRIEVYPEEGEYAVFFFDDNSEKPKQVCCCIVQTDLDEPNDSQLDFIVKTAYVRSVEVGLLPIVGDSSRPRFVLAHDSSVWFIPGLCCACHSPVFIKNDFLYHNPFNSNYIVHKNCLDKLGARLLEDINQEVN